MQKCKGQTEKESGAISAEGTLAPRSKKRRGGGFFVDFRKKVCQDPFKTLVFAEFSTVSTGFSTRGAKNRAGNENPFFFHVFDQFIAFSPNIHPKSVFFVHVSRKKRGRWRCDELMFVGVFQILI